jgi:hypothetical protein
MSTETFGIIEMVAFFGIALALLAREYWALNRDNKRAAEEKRQREAAEQAAKRDPAPPA